MSRSESQRRAHKRWLKTESGRKSRGRWTRKRRWALADMMRTIKEGTPCADCGRRFPYYVMDFDHTGGDKEFNLGNVGRRAVSRVLSEMAKCDVVCANCHRIREHGRHTNIGSGEK